MKGGTAGLPGSGGGGGEVREDFEDLKTTGGGFAHLAVEIGLGGVELHGDLRPAPAGHGLKIGGQRGAVHVGSNELAGGGDRQSLNLYSPAPILLPI